MLVDLDGTLVDSEPAHRAAYEDFFAARGWSVDDDTYLRHFSGRRGAEVFATVPGPWSGEDPQRLVDAVLEHLPRHLTRTRGIPGAVELLTRLHERQVPVALVTSAHRAWAVTALADVLHSAHLVQVQVTSEDVAHGKPDPAGYLLAARRLGVAPSDTVVIEDSGAGIAAGVAAGAGTVVGVRTSLDDAALRAAGARYTVADLTDVALTDVAMTDVDGG